MMTYIIVVIFLPGFVRAHTKLIKKLRYFLFPPGKEYFLLGKQKKYS